MWPGPNWKLNISKLFRKSISTLTGLIVSLLVRKCIFYRPELTGKLGPHETGIKFLKFKSEMCQQIELKEKEVIRLVMFTPRVMVIKMSRMAGYFLLDTAKN